MSVTRIVKVAILVPSALIPSAIVIFALAESNASLVFTSGVVARRSSVSSKTLRIVDNAPLATPVPPKTSAKPARPPSAALVVRLNVSPREDQCLRVPE